MKGTCHIVCAGPSARVILSEKSDDLVIAVDGGFAYCLDAGIEPDLFVGDLDSLDAHLVERITCERIELPCDKDDTDTLYACKEGLARGYSSFILYSSLGGDLGHELANIQTLAFLDKHGAAGMLLGSSQKVCLVTPRSSLRISDELLDTRVSVFAFSGKASGVSLRGLRWELDDATLEPDFPVGVSNRSASTTFEIALREGMLVVVIGS